MKSNWVELLRELPVDATLQDFLSGHGLAMPQDFSWADKPDTTQALIDAISRHPDPNVKDPIAAKLHDSDALGDPAGTRAMMEAATGNATVLAGLKTCKSDAHRSFWLYWSHPQVFAQALDIDVFERRGATAQQHELKVRRRPDTSELALNGFRAEVSAFYQRELQCGDRVKTQVFERKRGVFLLSVHIKDLSTIKLEFLGDDLERRVGNPNIPALLQFSSLTGVARSLVRGGAKFHKMLITAFAQHLLREEVDAQRLVPPTLNLSVLRLGFDVPQAQADGFNVLQVKSISLLSPDQKLKIDCTAMGSSDYRCVTDLLRAKLPGPFAENWLVTAAQINLIYPPERGRTRARVVSIELTSKGRLNLHKFDPALQAQLEGYLVSLGILEPGQTLDAQEPDADAADASQDWKH